MVLWEGVERCIPHKFAKRITISQEFSNIDITSGMKVSTSIEMKATINIITYKPSPRPYRGKYSLFVSR
jgi:hypothetical protein